MVQYVPLTEFVTRFAPGELLGTGSCCEVFASAERQVVVKSYSLRNFSAFVREVNLLCTLRHPCLLPVGYMSLGSASVLQDSKAQGPQCLLTQRRGSCILDALRARRISLRGVATDLLHVLALVHASGWTHGDLKPDNVLFCDGRACLIDFSHTQRAEPFVEPAATSQGAHCYSYGPLYSPGFRDPSVDFESLNSQKCDLYALGRTLLALRLGRRDFEEPFERCLLPRDDELCELVVQCTQVAPRHRASALELLARLDARKAWLAQSECQALVQGLARRTVRVPQHPSARRLLQQAERLDLCACVSFLALHLLHVAPTWTSDVAQSEGHVQMAPPADAGTKTVQAACSRWEKVHVYLLLASCSYDVDHDHVQLDSAFLQAALPCLEALRGVVHRANLWDFASCREDLPVFMEHALLRDYRTDRVPKAQKHHTTKETSTRETLRALRLRLGRSLSEPHLRPEKQPEPSVDKKPKASLSRSLSNAQTLAAFWRERTLREPRIRPIQYSVAQRRRRDFEELVALLARRCPDFWERELSPRLGAFMSAFAV